jgi:RNA polymerase sigma-70 factor (ECF subfamily)
VSTGSGSAELVETALIQAVVAGDDRVAAQLYDHLVVIIDRTLFRVFGRREEDHDDLVQTAFEQVVLTLSRGSYAGGCSLKTWAARITSNVGLNALRSRRRERKVLDRAASATDDTARAPDLDRQATARAMLNRVMAELSEMNPRRAQAVFLHDVEGYDLDEIAKLTQVSVAAAQSRLVRGRKELLKRLETSEKRARLRWKVDA